MHAIEKELIELTGFEPSRTYKIRQDYLAALARAADQYFANREDDFEKLTKEAAEWFNAAARAVSNRKVIPEFDEEVATADAPMPEPDLPEEPVTEDDLLEEPEEPVLPVRTEPPPKRKRKNSRTVPPGLKKEHPEVTPEGEAIEEAMTKLRRRPPKDPTVGPKDTSKLDKWGFALGSKNSAAATMFEKGCRMSDVRASLGSNHYNVLRRVARGGHRIDHFANKVIQFTFKNKPGPKT